MKRKITKELLEWQRESNGKALLVTGARQVGKSYAIREFGKAHYAHYAEINLFDNQVARKAFSDAQDVRDLIARIELFANAELREGTSLVFIDEVQELPDIMTWAKFLVEDGRYAYAFSGSMLGVEFKGVRSYPVGFVRELVMRPMDFEEYCWATGISEGALDQIHSAFEAKEPLPEYLHDAMLNNYRTYMVVGGMPEVVKAFVESRGSLAGVRTIQSDLVTQYRHDISKYAENRSLHVRDIFDGLPLQLDGDQRRFLVNSVDPNARYERYKKDFVWLRNAGVALKCDQIGEPKIPLDRTRRESKFKLYQSDTGMLVSRYGQSVARSVYLDERKPNLGGIYENVIAQELVAAGFVLRYWQVGTREVDFCVETASGSVLPIEVKSGRSMRTHASLDYIMQSGEYGVEQGVVLSRLNVEYDKTGRTVYLPFYMTMCLGTLAAPSDDFLLGIVSV